MKVLINVNKFWHQGAALRNVANKDWGQGASRCRV